MELSQYRMSSMTDRPLTLEDCKLRIKELEAENFELKKVNNQLKQQINDKATYENVGKSLEEWIPIVYKEKFRVSAKTGKVTGPGKDLLLPYVAAFVAGYVEELNVKEFCERYGVKVKSTTYSNWTKNYLKSRGSKMPIDEDFLYTRQELLYCWRRFKIPQEEILYLVEDMKENGLL